MEVKSSLPLLPLRDIVVFPSMVIPLFVGRDKSISALNEVMKKEKKIILVTQKNSEIDDPKKTDIFMYGCEGSILQLLKLPDGTVKVLVEGVRRVKIIDFKDNDKFINCDYTPYIDITNEGEDLYPLAVTAVRRMEKLSSINKKVSSETINTIKQLKDPSQIADNIASHITATISEKQQIFETIDVKKRLNAIIKIMENETSIIGVEKRIRGRVKTQMEKTQREYYLNEQLKAIQKELGEIEDGKDENTSLNKAILKSKMPKDVEKKCLQELKKLKNMSPMSAEATVVRNYLDWMVDLPWHKKSDVVIDLKKALDVLDKDHFGLEKVKERIIEFLAVQKRMDKIKGPILCLVGPPGVGKTSLGKSIAKATNREFVRMSVGGMRDEAEIRGHRRTYIGSMPGRFIQAMKKTKTSNPIILLDEIDKVGSDWRGDPSSALLEVLDPEQNNQFNDHYLEVDYDLSNVMFICTGNTYNIPGPLLDRLEVIEVSGYTEKEKVEIAKKYLIPRKMNKNILKNNEFKLDKSSITKIVRHYTRESGVRGLEKVFDKLFRKLVFQLEKSKSRSKKPFVFDDKAIKKFLGPEKFKDSVLEKKNLVGITNGLAWTQVGGDILNIEVNLSSGKGMINATGKLGDVMKESITAALGYIKSNSVEFGVNPKVFDKVDIHLHVPEGAIPKDGPSAGITIFTSLISSLTDIKIKRDIAMTGEITLKGRVLPIGGLKEKLLAAIRYGIKTVIIPKENEKDLIEIQKDIQNKLVIKKVEFAREVLDLALDGKISKINKKLDWRHLVTESMKPKNQQNQEKSFVN